MRRALVLILAAAVVGGCGGDDDEPAAGTESTGTEGAEGVVEGASYDITAGEFIAELQPAKQRILKEYVVDSDACQGLKVDPGFVLLVTAQASDADQGAPLAELVEDEC